MIHSASQDSSSLWKRLYSKKFKNAMELAYDFVVQSECPRMANLQVGIAFRLPSAPRRLHSSTDPCCPAPAAAVLRKDRRCPSILSF